MIASKKDLEILLSRVRGFAKPRPELEQYLTPSSIVADLLWAAYMDGNINLKTVLDLGCGTGIFALGAALLGARQVRAYEIDPDPLKIAKENLRVLEETKIPLGKISFVCKDIKAVARGGDTVVMNPPFGVQRKGADKFFLLKAFDLAKRAIYSIHLASAFKFVERFAREHDWLAIKLKTATLPLKLTMAFHRKAKYPLKAVLVKFVPR